ncbi:MAG: NUDIX domain-containing protein [archaeon]|nr:MAG: NUDIX domain-containing protein [archaeon]
MKRGIDFIGVGVGALIFNSEGKVFLAKRGPKARNEPGRWDFPGGGVEFGEKIEDAIRREIKEEFDMDIEVLELLDVCNHIIKDEGQHWVSPSFIARQIGSEPRIVEPEKNCEIGWFSLDNIPTPLTLTSQHNYTNYKKKFGLNPPGSKK